MYAKYNKVQHLEMFINYKLAVYCHTREDSNRFLAHLKTIGFTWYDNKSLETLDAWGRGYKFYTRSHYSSNGTTLGLNAINGEKSVNKEIEIVEFT